MPVLSIVMPWDGGRELCFALAVLTVIDMWEIRTFNLPGIYESGVRYRLERAKECWVPVRGGCEDWLSARELLRQGVGDCEDLCCFRAAGLRLQGERAYAIPRKTRIGWHIQVRRGDGSIEDPSARLGMRTGRRRIDA